MGSCKICGKPTRNHELFPGVFVCHTCYVERREEVDQLKEELEEGRKKRKQVQRGAYQGILDDLYEEGYRLYERKRYGEAAKLFQRALELDPEDVDTGIALAGCLISMGRFVEAAQMMKDAALLHPNDPLIHYNLGYVLACMGRLSEAKKEAKRCLKCECPLELEAQASKLSSLLKEMRRDEEISFEKEVICYELFLEAQQLLYSQRYREAIQIYEQILKLKPNQAASIMNIGLCFKHLGEWGKALEYLRRGDKLDESAPLSVMNMAQILQWQGDYEKAEEYVQKGLKRVSPVTPLRDIIRIAAFLIETKMYGKAEIFLKGYLKDRRGDIQLTFFLGVAMAKQGKLKKAREAWREIKDRCQKAREYMESAEKVMRGEKTLEEADFKTLIVTDTIETL